MRGMFYGTVDGVDADLDWLATQGWNTVIGGDDPALQEAVAARGMAAGRVWAPLRLRATMQHCSAWMCAENGGAGSAPGVRTTRRCAPLRENGIASPLRAGR